MSELEERRSSARVTLPLWAAAALFAIAALLLISSSVWLFRNIRAWVAGNTVTVSQFEDREQNQDGDTPTELRDPSVTIIDNGTTTVAEATTTAEPLFDLNLFEPWQGSERVNVLLLGIDTRCEEEGPTRTDSMMLISIDPVNKGASALSLPRDLWVEIPAFGVDRINKAHYLGEINDYPGGGPALAVETVENFIGVNVDHYVAVNFEAFRDFINLIDGIQIDVPLDISDPTYPDECYGYDPFYMRAGLQSMNGPIALKYARTRATDGGDIDRAERQQQVILAVRQKLLDVNMIPRLATRAPQLWRTFQRNVRTSFSETETIQLALLVQEIPREKISTHVIDYNYVFNESTPSGQLVLVPNYELIRELRRQLYAPIEPPEPTIENLPELVASENARVVIHNGTQTFGLASATEEFLAAQGINIVDIGNAEDSAYPVTQVIDYGRHPYTRLYLTRLMDLPPLNASSSTIENDEYDILIILGQEWIVPEQ